MNDSIRAVLLLGKYGAGKTDLLEYLMQRLETIPLTQKISFTRDRIFIEEEVVRDVSGPDAIEKGRVGQHSTLIKPDEVPGKREFAVSDGVLHRLAHEAMIESIRQIPEDQMHILEIGIGPIVLFGDGREPLVQSGSHFLQLLQEKGVMDRILVVEVDAPYDVRFERNKTRKDPVPEGIFVRAATDGDEFWRTHHGLNSRYVRFNNSVDNRDVFEHVSESILFGLILPHMRVEGQSHAPERR